MKWSFDFLPEARKEFNDLDVSVKPAVAKMIDRVRDNPLPASEGGYGKPLGSHSGLDLTGLLKTKLVSHGIRVVYKLERTETSMTIIVIGIREDGKFYKDAAKRREKYGI